MPRTARLKVVGDEAYYHIISRTIHRQFLMGNIEKEQLIHIIKNYSKLYLVKVIGYCIMSNHFHLLIKTESEEHFTDYDIQKRVEGFYGRPMDELNKTVNEFRRKLSDVSEYIKQIKQRFSWQYNRLHNTTGTFWSERFKSILVEDGNALLTTLAYIDLNPLRAGIVKKPEGYRFSGIGYRYHNGNRDHFLCFDGIADVTSTTAYLEFLYSLEGIQAKTPSTSKNILTRRLKYMTEGLVIGSKAFIMEAYNRFGGTLILKADRKAHPTGISPGLLSIRKLMN